MMHRLVCWLIIKISFIFFGSGIFALEELDNADSQYVKQYITKAVQTYNKGQYEESLNHIRHVIKSDMTNLQLRYLAAYNHWKNKNYASAEAHMKVCLQTNPQNITFYKDLALIYLEQNKHTDVIKLLKNIDTQDIKIFNLLARTYLKRANFNKAHLYIKKAKKLFEQSNGKYKLETLILEARIYLEQNKLENAETAISWAASLKYKSPYLYNLIGMIYKQLSHKYKQQDKQKYVNYLSQAKKYFNKALLIENTNSVLQSLININLKSLEEL